MARSLENSRNKGQNRKTLGVIGVSLSLAGAGCATSSPADASTPPPTSNMLHEEEVNEVGISSFRLFDRDEPQAAKSEQLAWWGGCRGCSGCRGCRGCSKSCR